MKSKETDEDKRGMDTYESETIGGTLCLDHEKLCRIFSKEDFEVWQLIDNKRDSFVQQEFSIFFRSTKTRHTRFLVFVEVESYLLHRHH